AVVITVGPPVADLGRGSQPPAPPAAPVGQQVPAGRAMNEVIVTAAAPVVDVKKTSTGGTFAPAAIEFSSPDLSAIRNAAAAGGGGGRGGGRSGGGQGGAVRPPTRWRVRSNAIVERSI